MTFYKDQLLRMLFFTRTSWFSCTDILP